jgi:aryl sulfotransferase
MPEAKAVPQRTRVYQNHHLDSTRWDAIALRPDDIVITTAYKAGTTWMQTIVGHLIFWGREFPEVLLKASPWLDMRILPLDEIRAELDAQQHRRFIKTHLPLDGLPYREDLRYILVGRDPRDVFMSLWNHYRNYSPLVIKLVNEVPGRVGDPFPPCPDDIHELWSSWISRGWFEWESDGWPWFSLLHHAQSYWNHRHLPNLFFVHYADLKADLEGEIRRIAGFLGIEHTDEAFRGIAEAVHFDTVKKNPERITGDMSPFFQGGAQSFIFKGTNGRWKDVLTEAELAQYRAAMERTLEPACARWMEQGGPVR